MFWKSREYRAQTRNDREWREIVRDMAPGAEAPPQGQERMRAYLERLRSESPYEAPGRAERAG